MALPVPLIATVAAGVLALGFVLFAIFETPRAISYDDRRRRRSPSPPRRPPSPPRRPRLPPPSRRRRSPSPPSGPSPPPSSSSVRDRQNSRSPGNDSPPQNPVSTSPPRSASPPPVSTHQENSSAGTSATNSVASTQNTDAVAVSSALLGDEMALNSASPIPDPTASNSAILESNSELPTDALTSTSALDKDDVASTATVPVPGPATSKPDALTLNPALPKDDSAPLHSVSAVGAANSALPGDEVASSSVMSILDSETPNSVLPTDAVAAISALPEDDRSSIFDSPSRPGSAASNLSIPSVTSEAACHRSAHCENCDDIIADRVTFIPCGGSFFCRKCGLNYLNNGKHCYKCGKIVKSMKF